jgi:hypothetical protein
MAVYLLREVGRSPADAHATAVPTPSPTAIAVKPTKSTDPPTHATLPTQPTKRPDAVVTDDTPPSPSVPQEVPPPTIADIGMTGSSANPKLDAVMSEANKAYDRGDFDEAKQIAEKVLAKNPGNPRMLRILVSSECIAGDQAVAQKYFAQLPAGDRAQMRTRCDRYGVTLKDP